jgi:hypothetical protein
MYGRRIVFEDDGPRVAGSIGRAAGSLEMPAS